MSYQEKRIVVSIISGVSVLIAYCMYTFNRYSSGAVAAGDLKFWAGAMLTFIGIGIVATIIIQIVFHILMSIGIAVKKKIQNEHCDDKEIERSIGAEMVEDEMDKLIDLKANWIGFAAAGIGFIGGLISILIGYSAVVMINIIFISFSVGSILEGIGQIYFYRRGVANG